MEMLFAVGIGIGLASVAGVRAFLPLVLVGLFARLGLFALPASFGFLDDWVVIGVFAGLALLESGLDKIPSLDPVLDYVQTPLRIIAGAILFAAALQVVGIDVGTIPELAAGGVIAGLVAVLKTILRPAANAASAGVSASFLSLVEDAVAVLGGIIAMLVPLVPLPLVAFLLFFFFRVRRRRGRKYGGLRILGD